MLSRPKIPVLISAFLAGCASAACAEPALDRYGGTTAIRREATGFFRVEQINGRWLFVTPEGHGFLALGVNHVGKFMEGQADAFVRRIGGERRQADTALFQAMADLGLNAGEAYVPHWPPLQAAKPWVAVINFPDDKTGRYDVFDPAWQTAVSAHVTAACREFAANPFVLGVAFTDVPEWGKGRFAHYAGLPAEAPGRRRLEAHRTEGGNDDTFLALVADTLYATLKAAVRTGAPRHLFLGERLVVRIYAEPVLRAMARHVDVLCLQAIALSPHRPPDWQTFQADGWRRDFAIARKPVLIVDWAAAFSSADAFDSPRGRLKSEPEAARDVAEWIAGALAEPYVVGLFWCQLAGTHINDRHFLGPAKRTLLRDDATPWPNLTTAATAANRAALQQAYAAAAGESSRTP
jgi:hypothetical protein